MVALFIASIISSIVLLTFIGGQWLVEMFRRQRDYSAALSRAERLAATVDTLTLEEQNAQRTQHQFAPDGSPATSADSIESASTRGFGTRSRAARASAAIGAGSFRSTRYGLARADEKLWEQLVLFHVSDYVSDCRLRELIDGVLPAALAAHTEDELDADPERQS